MTVDEKKEHVYEMEKIFKNFKSVHDQLEEHADDHSAVEALVLMETVVELLEESLENQRSELISLMEREGS